MWTIQKPKINIAFYDLLFHCSPGDIVQDIPQIPQLGFSNEKSIYMGINCNIGAFEQAADVVDPETWQRFPHVGVCEFLKLLKGNSASFVLSIVPFREREVFLQLKEPQFERLLAHQFQVLRCPCRQ